MTSPSATVRAAGFTPAVFLCLLLLPTTGPAGEPVRTDLFESGKGDYALYRIPGTVVTARATLLAYCEARKHATGDWGHIDVLLRRSTDGKTWEPARQVVRLEGKFERNPLAAAQKLGREGEITVNNPVAIADRSGAVHFLYCVEYARCFYQRSDDDGRTFGKPVEITAAFEKLRPAYPWKVLATGPGHGIQLTSGRLLVPVWLSRGTGGHAHRPSAVCSLYSDDGGKTWQAGDVVAGETEPLVNPSETAAVELADGRVLFNMRSESKQHRRAVSVSKDGAAGWSKPAFDDQLLEPICMASLVRLGTKAKGGLLFANPHNLEVARGTAQPGKGRERRNLAVKLSRDEGKTWPVSKVLDTGLAAYSDLAVGPDGSIYCFYERGADGKGYRYLTMARFDLAWLTDGKDGERRP